MPVIFCKVRNKPAQGEMDPFVFNACAVIVNERIRYNRNYNLVAQAFLNHPFADMNTFDVPYFPPLMEIELHKTILERSPGQEPLTGINDVFQGIGVIPLDAFFPGDIFHTIPKGLVEIVYIRNAVKVIIKTNTGLFTRVSFCLPPLVPRLMPFPAVHVFTSRLAVSDALFKLSISTSI
jgi:hypothetical protein